MAGIEGSSPYPLMLHCRRLLVEDNLPWAIKLILWWSLIIVVYTVKGFPGQLIHRLLFKSGIVAIIVRFSRFSSSTVSTFPFFMLYKLLLLVVIITGPSRTIGSYVDTPLTPFGSLSPNFPIKLLDRFRYVVFLVLLDDLIHWVFLHRH